MASTQLLAVSVRYDGPSASILVALSLGLLEAVLGYDVGDEVVVVFQRGKILFGEFTPLRADFLENDLLGLGSHLRLAVAALDVVFVTVNT